MKTIDNAIEAWLLRSFTAPGFTGAQVQRCERDGRRGIAVLSIPAQGSDHSAYRHALAWLWDDDAPILFVIMLNPSTAGAFEDDQTMRKVFGFARQFGYGGVIVLNQHDFRATNPADAKAAGWPTTPYGRQLLHRALNDLRPEEVRRDVLCAWGNHGPPLSGWATGRARDARVRLYHLGLTKRGCPEHPCMIGYDRALQEVAA